MGGTGYLNIREVLNPETSNPEYGFLYAERGKSKKNAVLDFIREKENPIINELPNLALPVHTPDLFTYTSQMGSGQFRLYRGGTGAFFDNEVSDVSTVSTGGVDIGVGGIAHSGVTLFNQSTFNTTRKWTANNEYLKNGDFQDGLNESPAKEHVYFRKVDEKNIEDKLLTGKLFGSSALAVNITGKNANSSFSKNTGFSLPDSIKSIGGQINKEERQVRQTIISYLTASEAKLAGLDKSIKTYPFLDSATFNPNFISNGAVNTPRDTGFRKPHHISEITVTGGNGDRMVYGIPVYNKKQEEYSFAVGNYQTGLHGCKRKFDIARPGSRGADIQKGY